MSALAGWKGKYEELWCNGVHTRRTGNSRDNPCFSLPTSGTTCIASFVFTVFVTVRIFVYIKRDEGVVGITIFRILWLSAVPVHAHTHNNNSYYVQSEAVFIDVWFLIVTTSVCIIQNMCVHVGSKENSVIFVGI